MAFCIRKFIESSIVLSSFLTGLYSCKHRDYNNNSNSKANERIAQQSTVSRPRKLEDLIESKWSEFDPNSKCNANDLGWKDASGNNRPCPILMKGYILGNIHLPQVGEGYQTGVFLAIQSNISKISDLNNLKNISLNDDQARILGNIVGDLHKTYQINYRFQDNPDGDEKNRVFGLDRIKTQFLFGMVRGLSVLSSVNRLVGVDYTRLSWQIKQSNQTTLWEKVLDLALDKAVTDLKSLSVEELLLSKKIAVKFSELLSSQDSFKGSAPYRKEVFQKSLGKPSSNNSSVTNTDQPDLDLLEPFFLKIANELDSFIVGLSDAGERAPQIANWMIGSFSRNYNLIKINSPNPNK